MSKFSVNDFLREVGCATDLSDQEMAKLAEQAAAADSAADHYGRAAAAGFVAELITKLAEVGELPAISNNLLANDEFIKKVAERVKAAMEGNGEPVVDGVKEVATGAEDLKDLFNQTVKNTDQPAGEPAAILEGSDPATNPPASATGTEA